MDQPSAHQPNIKVLIVDDIVETRENLKKLLYFVQDIAILGTAASGKEGIQMTVELQPDIVLLDVDMPGVDGITASQRIVEQVPTAQVILMFTQDKADYQQRCDRARAKAYLVKPFDGVELEATIRRVYQQRS
jgi:pilus assembly protein CpaE